MQAGGCRFLPRRDEFEVRRLFDVCLWESHLWIIPAGPDWGFGPWNGGRFLHKKCAPFLPGRVGPSLRCFLPESWQGPDACRISAWPGRRSAALDADL